MITHVRPEKVLRLALVVLHEAALDLGHCVAHCVLQPCLAALLIRDLALLLIYDLASGLRDTGAGLVLRGALLLIHNLTDVLLTRLTNILKDDFAASIILTVAII